MILRFEIAVSGTHRRVCHLGKHRVNVTVGSGDFDAAPYAGAFIITGTAVCTSGRVLVGSKATHVGPGFSQQPPGPTLADPGNCVELFYRGPKRRGRYRPQPLAHAGDLLLK